MDRIPRVTARVLPVSPDGAVLMLLDFDPANPEELRWGTIGGALDPGETLVEGVLRELFEETGIVARAADLTDPFRRSSHDFSWDGRDYTSDSTFFALPLARDIPISFEHVEEDEVDTILEARWWTPADLEQAGGMVDPAIPEIMAAAVGAVLGGRR